MFIDGGYSIATFNNGVLQGPYIRYQCKYGTCDFTDQALNEPKHLKEIAVYNKGHKVGISYHFKSGGGFVVELNESDGMYVYPDLKTMIVGTFKMGQLVSGLEAELKSLVVSENGLMLPIYEIKGHQPFKYSAANQTYIGSDPLLTDPMEDKYVYVSARQFPSKDSAI